MTFGLGVLGLPPAVFWSMTPKELEAALVGKLGNQNAFAPPTRADLTTLMQRFPD